MTTLRPSAVLLAITLAVAGTAACGDESPPAPGGASASSPAAAGPATNGTDTLPTEQALDAATKAFLAADTVHLKGDVVDAGEKVTLDVRQKRNGDASGTIGVGGVTMTVMTIGKSAYISGDKAFWTEAAGAGAYRQFKGKWIKTRLTAADFKDLALFTDRAQFAKEVLPTEAVGGGRQTVNGTPALGFTDNRGGNFYVALEGEPYPLRLAGTDGDLRMTLDFLDYDKPLELTPPPAGKIIEP
jgi:hypothetical protein